MKKIFCVLLMLLITSLKAETIDSKREILDSILQIENYSTVADQMLQATESTLTKEEFLKKFFDAYSQNEFQENLRSALDKKFTSEQLDEIHSLVINDLYKKYSKEFYTFNLEVAPQMMQLILNNLQQEPVAIVGNHQGSENNPIVVANESNFDDLLNEHDSVLVDVYATWCGPCKAISPILQELSREFEGKYVFVKIDADANPALIAKLKAKSLPTLIFYKKGKEVHRKVGFADRNQLVSLMDSYFKQ